MKRVTSHHDGHGRMERLLVLATDEPATQPPGNSSHHHYAFYVLREPLSELVEFTRVGDNDDLYFGSLVGRKLEPVAILQFQRGPFDTEGSTPGTLANAVLAALIDHLEGFQNGPLKNRETALAVTKLEEALAWLRARADKRAAAGTLGTMAK